MTYERAWKRAQRYARVANALNPSKFLRAVQMRPYMPWPVLGSQMVCFGRPH